MGAPGCDDAPVVKVKIDRVPRGFTLMMPYYENAQFFEHQLDHLRNFPLSSYMRVIIVDDGSPEKPAEAVARKFKKDFTRGLQLYRIDVDVRWNWLAARNIGFHHAMNGWVAVTDMDHILPYETAVTLVFGLHDEKTIYRFSRTGAKTHPHPNSWFMTRNMYWRIGGYDEALSGHYGTDGEYRRRCAATAPICIMDVPLELHEHEGDASTTHYKRKQPEDAAVKKLIKARGKDWKPKVLSFPYHEVEL